VTLTGSYFPHPYQNWSHVISYVNKALATPEFAEGTMKGVDHSNLLTGLNCAYGLAELATRKYKTAAKRFLMAQLDHCNIPDIMSAQVRLLSYFIFFIFSKDNFKEILRETVFAEISPIRFWYFKIFRR
jgi:hypothetical protein